MKKNNKFKIIQLVLLLVLAAAGIYTAVSNSEIYHTIATVGEVRALCIILWLTFVVSFIFLLIDIRLNKLSKKDFLELDYAVHSDPVSGLANRYSCDMIIEKYLDKPLPREIGCIMFDLSNIQEINRQYGHIIGNDCIRDFSAILNSASQNLCFVGRNGGNKFLALFETCSPDKISGYLARVEKQITEYNSKPGAHQIEYKYGKAFDEGNSVKTITELIALSNSRIYNS